jgi:transposase
MSVDANRWDEKAGLRRDALSSQFIDALEAHEIRRPAMRKPSTTALRRRGKLQDGQLTIGVDLGDRSSFYCVLNGAGEVILEERVATNPEAMKKTFSTMPRSRIALETGTHSPWVSRVLSELGHEAIVAHARNVRLIGESRRKDDRLDAQALARLAGIDPQLLSPIQHRSAQAQGLVQLLMLMFCCTA